MKNVLLIVGSCFCLFSCYDPNVQESKSLPNSKTKKDADKTRIVVTGSTTMSPIMRQTADYFLLNNTDYEIVVKANGSNEGMKSIYTDSADIAMSSNRISDSTVAKFRSEKIEYAEFLLAGDALVFIVNVNNGLTKMTEENLDKVFRGEITDWKELNTGEGPIKLYSRDASSGSYSFFRETVLQKEAPAHGITHLPTNEAIIKAVAKDKHAIGYVSFANLDYSVEPLGISFDQGKTYIQPRVETVNNLKYRFFRGLYLYYKPEAYSKIKAFMDTIKSDTVQKIIKKNGYIPLSHRLIHNH